MSPEASARASPVFALADASADIAQDIESCQRRLEAKPQNVTRSLPQDDLVFFLLDLIPRLDLTAFYDFYSKDRRGQPPFHVARMTTLLVYLYSVGVFSSRKIAGACERNLAFLAIVRNDRQAAGECRPRGCRTGRGLGMSSRR